MFCIDESRNYDRLFDTKVKKYLLNEYKADYGNIKAQTEDT